MREKGFAPIILLVGVLVVGVLVGGVYYWQKSQVLQLEPTTPPILTPTKQPVNLPQVDETANWKTFTDVGLNISFKYPPNWELKKETGKKVGTSIPYTDIILSDPLLKPARDCVSSYIYDCGGFDVRFVIKENVDNYNINTIILRNGGKSENIEDFVAPNGIPFKKVKNELSSGAYYYLYSLHNNKVYSITPSRGKNKEIDSDGSKTKAAYGTFETILSTFKFLPALPTDGGQNSTLPSPTITAGKYTIQLKSRQFTPDPNLNIVPIQQAAGPNGRVHFLLQVKELPNAAGRQKFTEQGINLLNYVSGYSYIASAKSVDINKIQNLTNVRWVGPLEPDDKIDPELKSGNIGKWARTSDGRVALTIQVHSDVSIAEAKSLVTRLGGTPTGSIPTVPSVTALFDPSQVEQIAREDAVQYIDMVEPPLQPNTKNLSPATAN